MPTITGTLVQTQAARQYRAERLITTATTVIPAVTPAVTQELLLIRGRQLGQRMQAATGISALSAAKRIRLHLTFGMTRVTQTVILVHTQEKQLTIIPMTVMQRVIPAVRSVQFLTATAMHTRTMLQDTGISASFAAT